MAFATLVAFATFFLEDVDLLGFLVLKNLGLD